MTNVTRRTRAPSEDEYAGLVGDVDIQATVEEYEKTHVESTRDSFVKLEEGDNVVRFLPPKPGEKIPWARAMVHRIPGSNPRGQDKAGWDKRVLCVASTPGPNGEKQRCPICAVREKLERSGSAADQATAKTLRPKLQVWAEVVVLTTEAEEAKGVQIFNYGAQIDEGLLGLLQGRFGFNFLHHQTGAPVLIKREGQGMSTKYGGIRALDRASIDVNLLRQRKDLARFVKLPTREEMADALAALGVAAPTPRAAEAREARHRAEAAAYPAAAAAPQRPQVAQAPRRPEPPPVVETFDDDEDEIEAEDMDFFS